jgi:hypothetical protein
VWVRYRDMGAGEVSVGNGDYSFWERSLAGEQVEMWADHPQAGFYKARFGGKDSPYVPVAIWKGVGGFQCKVGYDEIYNMRDAKEVWTWCCAKPISYATYRTACLTHSWPNTIDNREKLLDEADRAIALSEDGGELESLFLKLERARKKANEGSLNEKRMTDAKFRQLTDRLKERMKELKRERG